MLLPKKYKGPIEKFVGKPMVSYSQVDLWRDSAGFNTGLLGKYEYIRKYFLGHEYPDLGWAEFGSDVEDYICKKEGADKFFDNEKNTLDQIKPLGNFQVELVIDFDDFVLLGYIDDASEDLSVIRDYKTASESSKKKYYTAEYTQLDVYCLGVLSMTGKLPDKSELVIIERLGGAECMAGGGRAALKVGEAIWTHDRPVNPRAVEEARKNIITAAKDISKHYEIFLELSK